MLARQLYPGKSSVLVSRKIKGRRQHALFLWPVKLMLWISSLFLLLVEITCFKNHIDSLLTDTYSMRQIYSYLKSKLLYNQFFNSVVTGADIKNFLHFSSHKNKTLTFSEFRYLYLKDFWDIRLRTYNFEGTVFYCLTKQMIFLKVFLEIYRFF